jgi:hypothetical protein
VAVDIPCGHSVLIYSRRKPGRNNSADFSNNAAHFSNADIPTDTVTVRISGTSGRTARSTGTGFVVVVAYRSLCVGIPLEKVTYRKS